METKITTWREKANQIIKDQHWTQKEVAERIPNGLFKEASLGHKLSGYRGASIEDIAHIAKALNVSTFDLISEDPSIAIDDTQFTEMIRIVSHMSQAERNKMVQVAQDFLHAS